MNLINPYLMRIVRARDFLPVALVLLAGVLASRTLFGDGYFNMHDDLQIMRQLQMEKCFLDGQIPCRWVPDMGFGFGYPLFNYYPPLPYLVGQVLRLVGYSFVATAKGLFIISIVASGITMYMLAREFFGRLGGVVSAVFYIWAPYHAVDVYVRGAMNESWALIWFPVILLYSYKLITAPTEARLWRAKGGLVFWIIALALSWFALFTSHNLMVIVFTPFFALWCAMWVLYTRNFKSVITLAIAGIWSFGLAAFFTLPVLLEKNIVQTDTLIVGYYDYTGHFPNIRQLLFSRFWGYGPSVWLDDDEMSFQIGWLHWGISLVLLALAALKGYKARKIARMVLLVGFLFLFGWFAAFMTHSRSTFIWQAFEPLGFIQFSWRYLTMVILAFSFLAGAIVKFTGYAKYFVSLLLITGVVAYSWFYFLPEGGRLGPLTDEEKLTGRAWELQQTSGIYDYLPTTAKMAPQAKREELVTVFEGNAHIYDVAEGTNWARFKANAEADTTIQLGILQFPGWRAFSNGQELDIFVHEEERWGRMYVQLPEGQHDVELKLHDTPPRVAGNVLTLASWAILFIVIVRLRRIEGESATI